jgi:hypothetical protein
MEKTMESSGPQAPVLPQPSGTLQIVETELSASATRFSVPLEKNATDRPSGEKNGADAPSVDRPRFEGAHRSQVELCRTAPVRRTDVDHDLPIR